MYKCNDCEKTFEYPGSWQENRGEFWGMPAYETLYGCPYCNSTDYDEYDPDKEEEEEEEEEEENDG